MRPSLRAAAKRLPITLETLRIDSPSSWERTKNFAKEDFLTILPFLPMSLRKLTFINALSSGSSALGPAATLKRLSHLTCLEQLDLSVYMVPVALESLQQIKDLIPTLPHLKMLTLGDNSKKLKPLDDFPQISMYSA